MKAPPIKTPPDKEKETRRVPQTTPAKLVVELPADAKLYVDDQPMKTTSARRTFRTPQLAEGQTYYYILRAEVIRDGKTMTATKQVIVRAGEEIQASFAKLGEKAPVKAVASTSR